jgi:hypothetical protein
MTLSEGEAAEQREAMESLEKRLRRKTNETSNLADNLDRIKTEEERLRYFKNREMKIYVEVPFSGILSLSAQRCRCRTSRLQVYRVYRLQTPLSPLF